MALLRAVNTPSQIVLLPVLPPTHHLMMGRMGTSTASVEEPLVVLLGLARALPAMMVLAVHTVKPAQKVTLVMLPGVSLSVYLAPILLMTVHWRVMGTSSA